MSNGPITYTIDGAPLVGPIPGKRNAYCIIGLRAGEVVFDGPPDALTEEVLTTIYGAEDWNAMRRGDEEQSAAEADARDRMAALAR